MEPPPTEDLQAKPPAPPKETELEKAWIDAQMLARSNQLSRFFELIKFASSAIGAGLFGAGAALISTSIKDHPEFVGGIEKVFVVLLFGLYFILIACGFYVISSEYYAELTVYRVARKLPEQRYEKAVKRFSYTIRFGHILLIFPAIAIFISMLIISHSIPVGWSDIFHEFFHH